MDNKPVPDKLSELYNTLLSRRASNEHKDWELTITALELLAVTHRPFSILELSWAVTLHTSRHVTTVDYLSKLVDHQKLLSLIQPFIACVEPSNLRRYQVQLIYQSMKELILRRWEPNATYSGSPASERDDGQRFGGPEALILDICIRYLLLTEIDDQYLFSEEQIAMSELPQESDLFNDEKEPAKYDTHCSWEAWEEDMIQFNPAELGLGEFFVYASCYWLKYYSLVTAEALPNLASIEKLCRANSIRIRNWTQQNRRPGCAMPPRFQFDSQLAHSIKVIQNYDDRDEEQPVICVFCGAQPGDSPEFLAAARALAHELHAANAKLVYGGGTKGLMGEVAKTLVSLSGPSAVHGFIPRALVAYYPDADVGKSQNDGKQPERIQAPGSSLAEGEYGRITVVDSMHERKQKMAEQVLAGGPGSGFVALPGGYGTLEEVAENQLGIHDRGIVLLNVNGFWDGLVAWIAKAAQRGFIGPANKDIMVECKEVGEVIGALKAYNPSGGRLNLSWGCK
ncbi:hypothetical protein CBS115989_9222 [Aspergillus niger]|nr:hypothetical protein CBS115989_9222 [Aspergillus niger]KAI2841081.1 hypothetical protein CBS11232_8905 [Aspergillus niger]KAI2870887.1 hypothetical protein CBS115988_8947 [Aspergillus niger]